MKIHKPSWYRENNILIVNALTCGINKDGHEQYTVNPETGIRSNEDINDALAEICESIRSGDFSRLEVEYYPSKHLLSKDIYVPKYYDMSINQDIETLIQENSNMVLKSLGDLVKLGHIEITNGHGSPSSDQRLGEIPYIKVSDLRAGSVNINPTNMIPYVLAQQFWKGIESGLKPYDLISPERASKNIGEFCVLLPGQQNIVLTKEVIIIRTTSSAPFSQFFLMWALSLSAVRKQWNRIVFMQTNREDVGDRMEEILIPIPNNQELIEILSEPFKTYYEILEQARSQFLNNIDNSPFTHHIYLET